MFCSKCGANLPENSCYCSKCGAIIPAQTELTEGNEPIAEETTKAANVGEVVDEQPVAQEINEQKAVPEPHRQYVKTNAPDFRAFVDEHIRKTTKHQSALQLLELKPVLCVLQKIVEIVIDLWFTLLAIGLIILITNGQSEDSNMKSVATYLMVIPTCIGIGVSLLVFIPVFFTATARLSSIPKKYSGTIQGGIDAAQLNYFLNTHLDAYRPFFHTWEYSGVKNNTSIAGGALAGGLLLGARGAVQGAIGAAEERAENRNNELLQCIKFSTPFGKDMRNNVILEVKLKSSAEPEGDLVYIVNVPGNSQNKFWLYEFIYKSAPILQAAIEYYIQYYKDDPANQNIDYDSYVPPVEKKDKGYILQRVLLALGHIAAFVIVFVIFLNTDPTDYIKTVQSWQANKYTDCSLGSVMNHYLTGTEWKTQRGDGYVDVTVNGKAKGSSANVSLTIRCTKIDKDYVSFDVSSLSINNQPSTEDQALAFIVCLCYAYDEGINNLDDFAYRMYNWGALVSEIPPGLLE